MEPINLLDRTNRSSHARSPRARRPQATNLDTTETAENIDDRCYKLMKLCITVLGVWFMAALLTTALIEPLTTGNIITEQSANKIVWVVSLIFASLALCNFYGTDNNTIDQYLSNIPVVAAVNTVIFYLVHCTAHWFGYPEKSANVASVLSIPVVWIIAHSIYNWRNNINLFASMLSYVYEFLVNILLYISDRFATLDIRVAKYQNLDNYLVIFHILGGLFGLVYWSVRQEVLKNLLYVHVAVFAYQVLKYAYYNIYPELVKVIMDFIEWICPFLRKLIHRTIVNIEWMCRITLVSFKIWWASLIYAIRLVGLFWIPVFGTVAVIVACVLVEV